MLSDFTSQFHEVLTIGCSFASHLPGVVARPSRAGNFIKFQLRHATQQRDAHLFLELARRTHKVLRTLALTWRNANSVILAGRKTHRCGEKSCAKLVLSCDGHRGNYVRTAALRSDRSSSQSIGRSCSRASSSTRRWRICSSAHTTPDRSQSCTSFVR